MRSLVLTALVVLAACAGEPNAPPITPSADTLGLPAALAARLGDRPAEVLDREGDAYALVALSDAGVLLHWVDVSEVVVGQVLGPRVEGVLTASHFHPTAPSPRVGTMPPATVARQQAADPRLLAVLNGAFFETPGQPATQIAYPIAENGAVATGGSSPYGPGRPGARGERWGQPLRALALMGDSARVVVYDEGSGAPLNEPAFAEAVVSLAPDAHPNRTATRFHILGPVDATTAGASRQLLIATSDGTTTIDTLSALVRRLGVAQAHQITVDGGASVYVWNRRAGTLHRPTAAGGNDPQHLPHFLTLRLR